jgi:hypothetical protein
MNQYKHLESPESAMPGDELDADEANGRKKPGIPNVIESSLLQVARSLQLNFHDLSSVLNVLGERNFKKLQG